MNLSYRYPRAKFLLFCKTPTPGQVKTRLIPALGAEGASALHSRLVRQVAATLLTSRLCPIEFWISPDCNDDFFAAYRELEDVSFHNQTGADLGERMFHAVQQSLGSDQGNADSRADSVLLLGSDCPALSIEYLERALSLLAEGHDAVLGPALDGGYVLLGLSRAEPALFQDIQWGTDSVCAKTCQRMNQLGWNWSLLKTLWDIDRPEDLQRLEQMELPDAMGENRAIT